MLHAELFYKEHSPTIHQWAELPTRPQPHLLQRLHGDRAQRRSDGDLALRLLQQSQFGKASLLLVKFARLKRATKTSKERVSK